MSHSLFVVTHMSLEHDTGIQSVVRVKQHVDPERVRRRREVEARSQLPVSGRTATAGGRVPQAKRDEEGM